MQKRLDIEDSVLWDLLRIGNETAFEELYRRYFQVLFSYGKRLLNDEDVVKDAIQDLFIDIWQTHKNLNQAQSVKFYLIRSLRRKIHRSIKPDYLLGDDWENVVFKTKAGQIGITSLQLIDYQYLESIVFLQAVFNILFSNR